MGEGIAVSGNLPNIRDAENTMATMAMPILELQRSVRVDAEKARRQTQRVVEYSKGARADVLTLFRVFATTFVLKLMLWTLVRQQSKLIRSCLNADFTKVSNEDLEKLARCFDKIIAKERDVLSKTSQLGAEIRVWWEKSLSQLNEQIEHLDSIAQSLHVECDQESSLLLAITAEEFAKPKKHALSDEEQGSCQGVHST
jgi:hypothetical protein